MDSNLAALPKGGITEQDLELFKGLIAPAGTPEAQIKLAMRYAQKLGLDPLRKQVMIIETYSKGQKSYQIVVGIHGMGALVARQGDYGGIHSASVFPGEEIRIHADGTVDHEYEPLLRVQKPLGAWATCYRVLGGARVAHTVYLKFDDYVKEYSPTWKSQAAWMIEKTARAFAYRAAFPDVLSGIYAPEEFGARSQESDQATDLSPDPNPDWGQAVTTDGGQGSPKPPTDGDATTLAPHTEPLPWETEGIFDPPKGIHCGICGEETVTYKSKTNGKFYRQCKPAREHFLKTKDRAEYIGHYWKEEKNIDK